MLPSSAADRWTYAEDVLPVRLATGDKMRLADALYTQQERHVRLLQGNGSGVNVGTSSSSMTSAREFHARNRSCVLSMAAWKHASPYPSTTATIPSTTTANAASQRGTPSELMLVAQRKLEKKALRATFQQPTVSHRRPW